MKIQQLKQQIEQFCCGTVLDKSVALALVDEIDMAEAIIEHESTAFPDDTFEDGYIAALKFMLNQQGSNVREDYETIMEKN